MNKKITLLALVLVFALVLTACGCKHETWLPADCETPKTCESCGETEGAPLGHTWVAANCENAKTCESCGKTEGEALGHTWTEADCENAKTCETCKLTEGEALGHTWAEATTENPKTCETCGKTEGERIITDPRFTTAANQHLFGSWQGLVQLPGAQLDAALAPYVDVLDVTFTFEFRNDGTLKMSLAPADREQMAQVMNAYTVDLMYQEFASQGLDAEAANAAMEATYGMNVEEYVADAVSKMDFADLFSSFAVEYVYYVDGDLLYMGFSWSTMESDTYTLEGDTLYLPLEGSDPVAFTRVAD